MFTSFYSTVGPHSHCGSQRVGRRVTRSAAGCYRGHTTDCSVSWFFIIVFLQSVDVDKHFTLQLITTALDSVCLNAAKVTHSETVLIFMFGSIIIIKM